jgi:hypothetical protein
MGLRIAVNQYTYLEFVFMKATKATLLLPFLLVAFASFGQGILKINKFTRNNGNYLQLDTTRNDTWANMATEGYVRSYVAQYGGGGGGVTSYTATNGITLTGANFTLGGALAASTTITGSAYNMNFGAVGSRLSGFNAYTANGLLLQDGPVSGTFPYVQLSTGNAAVYGLVTNITGLNGLSLTSGGSNAITGATVSLSGSDSLKVTGAGLTTSVDTTAKPLWVTTSGRLYKGNHGSWTTSVFGRTGAVTAQAGDYSAYYASLTGSYANPTWITSLAVAKITWSGTSSQQVLGDGSLATKITNNNQLTNGAGYLTNITGYVTAGSNVSITGSGTSGSPYVINASGGGGGTYTFANGLTESGSLAKWGGTLTANTAIAGGGFNVTYTNVARTGFGVSSPEAFVDITGRTGLWHGNEIGLQIRQPDNSSYPLLFRNTAAEAITGVTEVGTITYLGDDGDFWIEAKRTTISDGYRTVEIGLNPKLKLVTINPETNGTISLWENINFSTYTTSRNDGATDSALYVNSIGNMKVGPIQIPLANVTDFPSQTGNSGKVLKTDGSTPYWDVDTTSGGGSVSLSQYQIGIGSASNTLTGDPNFIYNGGMMAAKGTLASGTIFDNASYTNNPLMLWYPRKAAFRAGGSSNYWDTDSVGNYSAAFGNSTKAKGAYSAAFGNNTSATGQYSFAATNGAEATGASAVVLSQNALGAGTTCFIAGGQNSEISAGTIGAVTVGTDGYSFVGSDYSFISGDANATWGYSSSTHGFGNHNYNEYGFMGGHDNVLGSSSTVFNNALANDYESGTIFGSQNRSFTGSWHFVVGRAVQASAANNIIAFGSGVDNTNTRMAVTEAGSFNVGFNSTVPTFVVHKAAGAGTYGLTEAYGAFKLGTTSTLANGTIRYTGTDFEGAVGGVWASLTTPTAANLPSTIVYNNQANTFNNNTIEGYSAKYNDQTGTTYTILSGDNGKVLTFNNASGITVTVPSGLPVGFNCMILQKGAGQITLATSSTTINNRQSYTKTAGQYAMATLVSISSNVFISSGDMSN